MSDMADDSDDSTHAVIDRIWPDPASALDGDALLAQTAFPAGGPWLRANFISGVDGAATREGRSGGLGGVGETLREVAWREFTVGEDSITLNLEREAFEGLPPIDPQRWPAHPAYVR